MKTKLFLCIALLAPLSLNAQKSQQTIAGVWQQVQQAKGDGHLIKLPVWKVLQNDGSFCTFLIANESGQSIITNQGRYEQTTDSTIVEHITGSITDPELIGRSNTLTYQLSHSDQMAVSYCVPGSSRTSHETWIRVKLEMPE